MDWTPLEHAAIALVIQLAWGWRTGNWWLGGLLACCWFAAREHTQAEYRWIAQLGSGLRANMPWWGGFDWRVWNWGSALDCLLPAVACVALLLIMVKSRRS